MTRGKPEDADRKRGIIRGHPPVAQWIRATDFGSVGRGFESLRAGQNLSVNLACQCFVASNLNNLYPHIYPQAGLGPRRWPANDDIHCVRDSL